MTRFEPCSKYYATCNIEGLWNKERYDSFVRDFAIKSAMCTSPCYITDHIPYFARFLSTINRVPTRRAEECYPIGRKFNADSYWWLFDHPSAFRTDDGINFIVSMPYGTPEMIMEHFKKMQKQFPEHVGPVDMYFVDSKYKFRKNGNYMLVFVWWPYAKFSRTFRKNSLSTFSATVAPTLDRWSEEEHPASQSRYECLYKGGLL